MLACSVEYAPRHPEESVLYRVVAEQLETFLARKQERDRPIPLLVEREFRSLAHLIDRVFPIVPVRQWVLSLPFALRYRMAYDASLTTDVLNVFIRALFGELRRRAHELLAPRSSQCGAVTFVQRYGDALNANVHFHCLVIDGVYAAGEDGRPEFHQLPAPEDEDVLRLTTLVSQRVQSLLERRGFGTDADPQQADPL